MNEPRFLIALILLLVTLAAGCPQGNGGAGAGKSQGTVASKPSLGTVVLIRSDLGLGDGAYIRELDTALNSLQAAGRLVYAPVGELPDALTIDQGRTDIGLPDTESTQPGTMTMNEATQLVTQAGTCALLVLSTPLLVQPALTAVAAGTITAGAILVMDDYKLGQGWPNSPVPVYVVGYEVRDVAFLSGVALAKSSANGMFTILVTEDDPHAEEYMKAAAAGARYQTTGAKVATVAVPAADPDGVITPEEFINALETVEEGMGSYFVPNHYIAVLGRATPTILQALSGNKTKAYVVGGYADYCRVRPAKVIGCMEKKPGVALGLLLGRVNAIGGLSSEFNGSVLYFGMAEGAVGFTDLKLYGQYNPDAADIKDAIEDARLSILADELDYDY